MANRTSPKTILRNYDQTHLECHAPQRHWWRATTAAKLGIDIAPAPWGHRIIQQCQNCKGIRHGLFDPRTGDFIKGSRWTYRPVEGYAIRGYGRINFSDFRREWIRRDIAASKPQLTSIKGEGRKVVRKAKRSRKVA